jgi:hypothetical protein
LCSNTANEILQFHAQFASLMARRIDDASNSQCILKYDGSETKRLARDISKASRSLSTNVTMMKGSLDSLVSTLEGVQVALKKGRSQEQQSLRSLKSLFKAIAILTTVSPHISALPPSAEPRRQKSIFPDSTLKEAAVKFLNVEPQDGKEYESLDSVILFFKEIIPNEARNTEKKLERFDEALYIKGLESRMKAGVRVTLYGQDPAAVAEEWRGVAEKYQSAF